jgi:hypothetical protein
VAFVAVVASAAMTLMPAVRAMRRRAIVMAWPGDGCRRTVLVVVTV